MIDLLINRRTRLLIAAKPAPDGIGASSGWGYRELDGPNLVVVQMEDPPAELAARLDRHRVVANPFAEYETDPTTKLPRMVRQSTVKLRRVDVWHKATVAMAKTETVVGSRE